jgi:hypothetical protein
MGAEARPENWLVSGAKRFVAILALLAGVTALVAALVVWLSSASSRTFAVAFYLAGAFLIVGAFLNATVGPSRLNIVQGGGLAAPGGYVPDESLDRLQREGKRRDVLAYVGLGIALLALGFLLDGLL